MLGWGGVTENPAIFCAASEVVSRWLMRHSWKKAWPAVTPHAVKVLNRAPSGKCTIT